MSVTQGYDQPECWITPLSLEEGALVLLYPTLIGREAAPIFLCSRHSSSPPPLGGVRMLSVQRGWLGLGSSLSGEGVLGKSPVPRRQGAGSLNVLSTQEMVILGCSLRFLQGVEDSCHQLRMANRWGTAASRGRTTKQNSANQQVESGGSHHCIRSRCKMCLEPAQDWAIWNNVNESEGLVALLKV